MSNADLERAKLLGNELTEAVEVFVATFDLTPEQHAALSNVLAAAIGRATSMAAGAVVVVNTKVEQVAIEVEALKARQVGNAH